MRDEFDSLEEPLASLHQRLLDDGARWQTHSPDTSGLLRTARQLTAQTPTHISGGPMRPEISTATRPTAAPRILRPWRIIPMIATILLVAFGFAVFHTFTAPKGTTPGAAATVTQPPNGAIVATAPNDIHMNIPANGYLGAISMDSANDGWAAGSIRVDDTGNATGAGIYGYFYHWHDETWTRAPETFPDVSLASLVMLSRDDGWAIGATPTFTAENGKPVVLRYSGGVWRTVMIPVLPADGSVQLTSIYAPSADFIWIKGVALGANGANGHWFVLSYHNGAWSALPTPFTAFEDDISMTGPNDGWAAQIDATHEPTTVHFLHLNNGEWDDTTHFPSTLPHISLASAQSGWAISVANDGASTQAYVLDGATWTQAHPTITLPVTVDSPFSITATKQGTLWYLAGSTLISGYGDNWQKQALPLAGVQLTQVTTDGDGGVWALGNRDKGLNPVILYDAPSGWTIYGEN